MRRLSDKKEQIMVRRGRVSELYSKGLSENQMARELNVSRVTINTDLRVMRNQALSNIQSFVEERLPHEYESLMIGVKQLLKKAWGTLEDERSSEKAVANAMHIILRCYEFKRQLLADGTDFAIGVKDLIESRQSELESERHRLAMEEQRARSEAIF